MRWLRKSPFCDHSWQMSLKNAFRSRVKLLDFLGLADKLNLTPTALTSLVCRWRYRTTAIMDFPR